MYLRDPLWGLFSPLYVILSQTVWADLPEFSDASNCAPVKLHAAADAVDARANHHDMLVVEMQVVLCTVVCQVQVVGEGRPLGGHSVDLLHHGQDGPFMTQLSHHKLSAANQNTIQQVKSKYLALRRRGWQVKHLTSGLQWADDYKI